MLDALAYQSALKLQSAGNHAEARKVYAQILARNPKHFESHAQLALIDFAQGRLQDALKANDRALKLRPDIAGLHNNHGTFQMELGRYKDAAASFERAVRLDARDAQARNNLGGALSKMGRLPEALASIDAAIALAPDYAKAHADRAMVLARLGRLVDSIASCDRAIALRPDLAEAHDHRGTALVQLGRNGEALASFEAAIAANPDFALAHGNRATALESLKREEEALASYERALALNPDALLVAGAAAQLRKQLCLWDGQDARAATILARIDAGVLASPPLPVLAMPSTPAQQKKIAALFSAFVAPLRVPARVAVPPRADKIRIGYFSADFGDHPVAHALVGVLEHHDRTRFEVCAFQIARRAGEDMRARLQAAVTRFEDVAGLSDADAAARARTLGIDIAVDLTGYTSQGRPGIFTYGAAPTQVAWLGYPGTLAHDAVTILLADATVIPPQNRTHFTETIIDLRHGMFPIDDRRVIAATPTRAEAGLPESGFVFCSFNTAYKITPALFEIWMRLLRGVEDSVLWLAVRHAATQDNLRAEAAKRGIDPARVVFAPRADAALHLARHRLAGLFLDTAPYGAHSTAADALQAGLPVLTTPGETFANRVAASLLSSVGMPELIAPDWSIYEQTALRIARDPALADQLKAKLAANLKTSPAFNTAAFTRALEGAYSGLVRP